MLVCPSCHQQITDPSDIYCSACGAPFSDSLKEIIFLEKKISRLEELKDSFGNELSDLKIHLAKIKEKNFFSPVLTKEIKEESEPISIPFIEFKENIPTKEEPAPEKESRWKNFNWELLLGFNGFLIAGVISIILGVGFFIRKAFVSGLLGPFGKVSIIYLVALLSLGLGNYFRGRKLKEFGLGIIGMAIAMFYYATYAAFDKYQIFGQVPAFAIMILITVFTVFVSVLDDNRWLAVLGLIGGFSTPVMLSSGSSNVLILFSYITILNLGVLAIGVYKRWNLLNNTGFVLTYLLFASALRNDSLWTYLIFLNIFFLIYTLLPFSYNIFNREGEKIKNTVLIFLNSFVSLIFNYNILHDRQIPIEYLSIIVLLYALNFILLAFYLKNRGREKEDLFIFMIAKASFFLILAIPLLFSGPLITVFWVSEALILLWLGSRLQSNKVYFSSFIVMLLGVVKLFEYDYPHVFKLGVFGREFNQGYTFMIFERFFTLIFVLTIYFLFVKKLFSKKEQLSGWKKQFATIFAFGWLLSLFFILNIEISYFFFQYFNEFSFVAISVLWAVFALGMMYFGLRYRQDFLRKMAVFLFLLTLGKVFLYDMSQLSASYKFISFIVLGAILIVTSYFYRNFKEDIINSVAENEQKN